MIDIQNFVNVTFNNHWDIIPTSSTMDKMPPKDELVGVKGTPMRAERMKYTAQLE